MKKLLITGFEPFGGEVINSSWEAVSLLPEKIGEYNLTKVRIPVVFEKSAQIVIDEAEKLCPTDLTDLHGNAGNLAPTRCAREIL